MEPETPVEAPAAAGRSALGAILASGEWVIVVEIPPPRSLGDSPELAWAREWRGPVAVPESVDSRLGAAQACRLFAKNAGVEPLLVIGPAGGPAEARRTLLNAFACSVRNVLFTAPGGAAVAQRLNGSPELGGGAFLIGVEGERPRDGCDFLVAPLLYDAAPWEDLAATARAAGVPWMATIRPLTDLRDAEYVANELGVAVPPDVLERMRQAEARGEQRAEGVAIASELLEAARSLAAGVRVLAPSGDAGAAIEVARAVRPRGE